MVGESGQICIPNDGLFDPFTIRASNHLEPIVHLVLSFAGGQIIAEEDGLLGLANLGKSLVGLNPTTLSPAAK